MGIFNFNKNKQAEAIQVEQTKSSFDTSVASFNLEAIDSMPCIIKHKNKQWVSYGHSDNYPSILEDVYFSSPTLSAILQTKAELIYTDSYKMNSNSYQNYSVKEQSFIDTTLKRLDSQIDGLSLDFQIQGQMAIEVIWSLDHTKIVEINHLKMSKLRSGEMVNGSIKEWYFSDNFEAQRPDVVRIPVFDVNNKEEFRQVLVIQKNTIKNDYYPEPSYLSALNWAMLESNVGVYYKALIQNGFNPGMVITFMQKPSTMEERDTIVSELKRSHAGAVNTSKPFILFAAGKELAPTIETLNAPNLDAQFTVISEQITTKILTGNRITTPELFGIAIPGQLGSADYETKVNTFVKFVVKPEQKYFNELYNTVLDAMKLSVYIEFNLPNLNSTSTDNTKK